MQHGNIFQDTLGPMTSNKTIKVPVANELNNNGKGVWLGRNSLGWVFLDRTASCNQPTGTEYLFVKASDWSLYWEDASRWKNNSSYLFYSQHIASIPDSSRTEAIDTVEALCAEYVARSEQLRHEMSEQLHIKKCKHEEALAADRSEQENLICKTIEDLNRPNHQERDLIGLTCPKNRIENLKTLMLETQKQDAAKISALIKDRNIKYLLHFTRIANLEGIANHGLLPRSELPPGYPWNDDYRYDNFRDAICLSVGFFNYKMFWYCLKNSDAPNWALLEISLDIFNDTPCLFYPTNAANKRFRYYDDAALKSHMGFTGLSSMYYDEPHGTRTDRELLDFWATDPQAEILAFGKIPVQRIAAVYLFHPNIQTELKLRELQPKWHVVSHKDMFEKRSDYKHWQGLSAVSSDAPIDDDIPF